MSWFAAGKQLRRQLPIAAALGCVGAAAAQSSSCPLTDHQCIQQEYPGICFDDGSKLLLEPCVAWLREIEQSPSPDVRSSAAGVYQLISHNPAAGNVQPELRARSAELIRGVLSEDPQHPDALLGFANFAETNEDRVRRLRDVVAADPGNVRYLEFLARALMAVEGGDLEAAAVYERAYELQMSRSAGDYARRFARNALLQYERAGSPERADRLRKRVAEDYDLAAMRDAVADAATMDPASLDRILQDLCREMTLTLFGAKPCLESIDHAIAAADRARDAGASSLERTITAAMHIAARSAWRLDAADSGWRGRFEAALRRYGGADAVDRLRSTPSEITVE